MKPVLWPYLFEVLVPVTFGGATTVVCKCIAYLAAEKREDEDDDYIIDFDRCVIVCVVSCVVFCAVVLFSALCQAYIIAWDV